MRISRTWFPALLLALAAGACRDLPTAAPPAGPTAPQAARAQLRCSVAVREKTVSCEQARPRGIRSQIILGGQGLNVRLRTTNVNGPDAGHVLSADISVQNLLDQPIGTDGAGDTHGVRVFFVSGPNVTEGSGEVTVLSDSVGTFTASNQKYFVYNEIIQPRQVSAPQTWQFSVDPQATRFEFLVLVETATPAETSVLHFRPERGSPVYAAPLYGVWAATPHDVFAVSDGAVLHYDGNYWRAMDAAPGCGCGSSFYALWGSDGRDVWAVGDFGALAHWTGGAWEQVDAASLAETSLYGIWGAAGDDIWAVGDGGTLAHYDGAEWSTQTVDSVSTPLYSVWGANVENVYAVGEMGTILHFNGGGWAVDTTIAGVSLYSVWGTGGEDVWAAGQAGGDGGGGGVLYHNDGSGWTEVADPEIAQTTLYSGWSSSPTNVWIASGGDLLHWDGEAWTRTLVGSGAPLYGVAGTGASDVFAVGEIGTILHFGGSGWVTQAASEFADIAGLWGSSESDVWAVGGPFILHRGATPEWAVEISPDFAILRGVWGASASEVWAVGEAGAIVHYDGGAWSTVHSDSALTLNAVWGSSATDVWAAGDAGALLHWNGTAWSDASFDTEVRAALWGSGPADVFAVGAAGSITRWTGTGWVTMNSGTSEYLRGVWGTAADNVYAVGDAGTVLHYDGNAGQNWTPVATGAPNNAMVFAVWGSGANDVFILANNGLDLLRWDGASWKPMSQFSARADVWMYTLWGTGPRNLYAAGDVGTILHGER
ncbi:MAG TPA: hypothetical protein VFJ16_03160 [Longimicrobium sp.]|nr:hypothetical protein [Longimicrobium sp.]